MYQVCFGNIHIVLLSIAFLPSFRPHSHVHLSVTSFIMRIQCVWSGRRQKTNEHNLHALTFEMDPTAAVSRSILVFAFRFSFLFIYEYYNLIWLGNGFYCQVIDFDACKMCANVDRTHTLTSTASSAIADRIGTCYLLSQTESLHANDFKFDLLSS